MTRVWEARKQRISYWTRSLSAMRLDTPFVGVVVVGPVGGSVRRVQHGQTFREPPKTQPQDKRSFFFF